MAEDKVTSSGRTILGVGRRSRDVVKGATFYVAVTQRQARISFGSLTRNASVSFNCRRISEPNSDSRTAKTIQKEPTSAFRLPSTESGVVNRLIGVNSRFTSVG